jgi:hypothetical protein
VLLGAGLAYEVWTKASCWTHRTHSFALTPGALLAVTTGALTFSLTAEILWEGLKAGLVTFGGAYTVIPYLHGNAVDTQHWLTDGQFVDGLAMSGVLPAPLIIFSTFVGYIAGGLGGAFAMTVGIFIPAFVFPIYFHRWLVAVAENPRIRPFLLGVGHSRHPRHQHRRRAHRGPRGGGIPRPQPLPRQADHCRGRPLVWARRRRPAGHRSGVTERLAAGNAPAFLRRFLQKTCAIASRDLSSAGQAEVNRSRVLLPHGCESQCPSRDVCRSAWKALAGGSRDTALEDVARERGSDLADV